MTVAGALLFIGLLLAVVTACFSLYASAGNEKMHPLGRYAGWSAIALLLLGIFTHWGW